MTTLRRLACSPHFQRARAVIRACLTDGASTLPSVPSRARVSEVNASMPVQRVGGQWQLQPSAVGSTLITATFEGESTQTSMDALDQSVGLALSQFAVSGVSAANSLTFAGTAGAVRQSSLRGDSSLRTAPSCPTSARGAVAARERRVRVHLVRRRGGGHQRLDGGRHAAHQRARAPRRGRHVDVRRRRADARLGGGQPAARHGRRRPRRRRRSAVRAGRLDADRARPRQRAGRPPRQLPGGGAVQRHRVF